jgi:hypothetical protein
LFVDERYFHPGFKLLAAFGNVRWFLRLARVRWPDNNIKRKMQTMSQKLSRGLFASAGKSVGLVSRRQFLTPNSSTTTR